jgi:hypothetical protein
MAKREREAKENFARRDVETDGDVNGSIDTATDTEKAVVPACGTPHVDGSNPGTEDLGTNKDGDQTVHKNTKQTKNQNEHYWGQAVQYLERGVQVRGSKKVTLLARREADRLGKSSGAAARAWSPRTSSACITASSWWAIS